MHVVEVKKKSSMGFQWQYKGFTCGKYEPQKHVSWTKGKFGKDNPRSKAVLELDSSNNIINKWDSLMILLGIPKLIVAHYKKL